ncbi:hypothetical protein BLGI_1705 [Brevibacillus laterosporus GI-9]|nr:hypothetical protein BLGI_1705 [Brevibacillus laterosporus GI-9]
MRFLRMAFCLLKKRNGKIFVEVNGSEVSIQRMMDGMNRGIKK